MAAAIVIVQTVTPFVIGGRSAYFTFSDRKPTAFIRNKARLPHAASETPPPPNLESLLCPACGAPVPLLGTDFPCPNCKQPVHTPGDYARTLELRINVATTLERAEASWRWSRWTSSRPFTWFLRVALLAWTGLVLVSTGALDWPWLFLAVPAIVVLVQLLAGNAFISVLADGRTILPVVPEARFFNAPEESSPCKRCGAPIVFQPGRFASLCPYCGGENFRAALTRRARKDAEAQEASATHSLLDSYAEFRERKKETVLLFGFLVIAQVFYVVIFAIGAFVDLFASC